MNTQASTPNWQEEKERLKAIIDDPNATGEALAAAADVLFSFDSPAHTSVHRLLEAIGQNPNTPVDTLIELLNYCPADVLKNPSLPLILLETPDFPSRLSAPLWRRLLRLATIPEFMVSWLTVRSNLALIRDEYRIHCPATEQEQDALREEAGFHIAVTGEGGNEEEWQAILFRPSMWNGKEWDNNQKEAIWEWIDLGLAPSWIAPIPSVPPTLPDFGSLLRAEREAIHAATGIDWIEPMSLSDRDKEKLCSLIREREWLMKFVKVLFPGTSLDSSTWERDIALNMLTKTFRSWLTVTAINSSTDALESIFYQAAHREAALHRAALHHARARRSLSINRCNHLIFHPPNDESRMRLWRFAILSPLAPVGMWDKVQFAGPRHPLTIWKNRLAVALSGVLDTGKSAHHSLLVDLASDGNRLVRVAARKRLAEPEWRLTWPEEPPPIS